MEPLSAGMDASVVAPVYERHRPEKTLFYQLVEQHYPAFVTQLAAQAKVLPTTYIKISRRISNAVESSLRSSFVFNRTG